MFLYSKFKSKNIVICLEMAYTHQQYYEHNDKLMAYTLRLITSGQCLANG